MYNKLLLATDYKCRNVRQIVAERQTVEISEKLRCNLRETNNRRDKI